MDVSSNQQFSDNGENKMGQKRDNFLNPNWSQIRRQQKSKAKSTCGFSTNKGSQEDQVFFYKQKAHQSFMQVIQIQQLHQQQIFQLRQQYEHQITSLKNQIKQKNQMIEVFEKNSSRHLIDFKNNLEMEDLGIIQCNETNLSKFDQSTILTFKEFLSEKQGDVKISSMRQDIFIHITNQITKLLSNPEQLIKNIKRQVNSIFQYVKQVRQQLLIKVQSHQALLKRYQQINANHKKLKSKFQSLQKDAILMSQNLKKIKEQKALTENKNISLQKKLKQLEKQARTQVNSKQNFLKISLHQPQKGFLSSKKLIESQKLIVKNEHRTLKTFKTYYDFEANKSRVNNEQKNNQKSFIDSKKVNNLQKNDDSFDVQDLIAQMSVGVKNEILNVNKNQKKTQLMVSQPLENRIRKKSFEN